MMGSSGLITGGRPCFTLSKTSAFASLPMEGEGLKPKCMREVLQDQLLKKYFMMFLSLEFATEAFMFWEDVEVYKATPETEERTDIFKQIFQKYFGPNSHSEMSLCGMLLSSQILLSYSSICR
jgi:hypothetical protein